MLRFFRNIRKTLMEQNKVRTYIFYAIGEILLVVVGILIALQVNNWNEERKFRNTERQILVQIRDGIIQDTTALNSSLYRFRNMRNQAVWIRRQFEQELPYTARMDTALALISIFSTPEADYTPFEYLQSVGISVVQDKELREMISKYYNTSKFLAETDTYFEMNKYYRQHIYPKYFRRYQYGERVKVVDYDKLRESNEFSVALDMSLNDASYYFYQTEGQLERARAILNLISAQGVE
ncbi:hypothetical protein AB2B38_008240 [Balneola sp. MJW-20]|uniref:hypothetical protein n=1 Tax=Gracilimonas aurantiaca TaxID=3234185 RepID=UPI003466114C